MADAGISTSSGFGPRRVISSAVARDSRSDGAAHQQRRAADRIEGGPQRGLVLPAARFGREAAKGWARPGS
jgi:hypothetical protein